MRITTTLLLLLLFCCVSGLFAQSNEAWRSYEKALSEYKADNHDTAIPYLNKAIKASPDFTEAYHMLAVCYDERGDVKKAISNYERVVSEKDDEKALYNLGLLYLSDNQRDKGLEAFQKSVNLVPDYKKPLHQIALLEAANGTASDAHPSGVKSDRNVRLYAVVNLYEQGQYQKAIDESHKIRQSDVNAKVFYMRGICHEKLDDVDAAIDAHYKAIGFDNTYMDAYTRLGTLHFNQKEYDEAYQNFSRAVELSKDDYDLVQFAGMSAYRAERYNDALVSLNDYLELQPHDAEAHYWVAATYSKTGNEARARQHLHTSADLGYGKAKEKVAGTFTEIEQIKKSTITAESRMSKKELKAARKRDKTE